MAKGDVGAVVGCLRYYAGWADKIEGKTIDIDPKMFHYTRPEPVRSLFRWRLLSPGGDANTSIA